MANDRDLLRAMAVKLLSRDQDAMERAKALLSNERMMSAVAGVQEHLGSVLESRGSGDDSQLAVETIVVRTGRPVLLVKDDQYVIEGPEVAVWKGQLDSKDVQNAMRLVIPAVGRIEVENNPSFTWLGTGWLVDDDIIVTNRHVAEEFGVRGATGFTFKKGWPNGQAMTARVDFKEEVGNTQSNEFKILDILHIEDADGPDIAFLKVERRSADGRNLTGKLPLFTDRATKEQFVATIGFPASDSRVPDQQLVRSIFGDIYNVKRFAPGQLKDFRDDLVLHDCSTLGGNSGSPIVDLASGKAVGLHFSGLYLQENRGISSRVVKDLLDKVKRGPMVQGMGAVSPKAKSEIKTHLQADVQKPQPSSSTLASDGTQTIRMDVTIPIEVTLRVGTAHATSHGDLASDSQKSRVDPLAKVTELTKGDKNIVRVRKGYVFENGWVTQQKAVVVAVRDLDEFLAKYPDMPSAIAGMAVEVRGADVSDYIQEMNLLETLEGLPTTTYTPPNNVSLTLVEKQMTVKCHLSPDAGWPTLQEFFQDTKKGLTIGMYDFTAPHIIKELLAAVEKSPKKLTLVMQEGASIGSTGVKKYDHPEEQTIQEYEEKLGDRFKHVKASVGKNHRFASAYHIKVAVRDGKAFWLSSGNWQTSNQPNHEQAVPEDGWDLLLKHNREWNVVIENAELASQFEAFIKHDFAQASEDAASEGVSLPSINFLVPETATIEKAPSGTPLYFEPLSIDRVVKVQPLLTPDNYHQQVFGLIESAEEQILFQNQSFSILDAEKNDPRYAKLFTTLLEKQQSGVDVRIIVRGEFDAKSTVERLKDFGFDTDRIRLQDRCHTKGIIVDKKVVMIGSHNWTNQGALVNRDASLIFFDEEIANYYAKAFWFDWKKLARKSVTEEGTTLVSGGKESIPAGMRSISLREYLFGE